MKTSLFLTSTALLFLASCGTPPAPSGALPAELRRTWSGNLSVDNQVLPLVIHLEASPSLDSPAQGSLGVPVTATWSQGELVISLAAASLRIDLKPNADFSRLSGTFHQGGLSAPFELEVAVRAAVLKRPQEPHAPFPYQVESFTVSSGLAGTVTLPAAPKGVVVLVAGSGPNDRDESLLGHKPLAVLADALSRAGWVTVRYDKRGVGQSAGDYAKATTWDFADDAQSVVAWARLRFPGLKVGIAGHSEGGLIAPMVQQKHQSQDFLILLAAPGVRIPELMARQRADISRGSGVSQADIDKNEAVQTQLVDLLRQETDNDAFLKAALKVAAPLAGPTPTPGQLAQLREGLAGLASPWYRQFLSLDPRQALLSVRVPVLALGGGTDTQVAAGPNLAALEEALAAAGNRKVTVRELPGLNHLFQPSSSGLPQEYGLIETTLDPVALDAITSWLDDVVGPL